MTGRRARVRARHATNVATLLVVIIAGLALVAPPATARERAAAKGWDEYTDSSGVSFEHPEAWTVRGGGDAPVQIFIDPATSSSFRRNVNILSVELPRTVSRSEYREKVLDEIDTFDPTIEKHSRTKLSGLPAERIQWTATVEDLDARILTVAALDRANKRSWVVTYTSDARRFAPPLPDVNQLISTIDLPR